MKKIFRSVISRFTMVYVTQLFYDEHFKESVNIYLDYYNDEWMASSKFSYRVKKNNYEQT